MTEKTQITLIVSVLIIIVTYLVSDSNILTNTGNYNKQGVQVNLDKPHFQYQEIEEYHENGISIGKVEGGVNSGSGTINNTRVKVGGEEG